MGRQKKPAAVLKATGSRHYTKEELLEMDAAEVKAPAVDAVSPPRYLPATLKAKFEKIAPVLIRMGIFSELDADCLSRYLIAESNYLRVTNRLTSALASGNLADADKLSGMQDRFFRQCRAAGADLGLTVSGRCRLVLPGGANPARSGEGDDLFGD